MSLRDPRLRNDPRRRLAVRAATVGVAVTLAVVLWALATQLLGVAVRTPEMGGRPSDVIPVSHVVSASGLAALAAWALLAVLERVTSAARRLWSATALVVLLVSLGAPLTGPGLSVGNRTLLVLLHLAVAVVVVPGFWATARRPMRPTPRSARSKPTSAPLQEVSSR